MTATPATINILQKAVRSLAGVCDGAVSQDGHGFNGSDAAWGHRLASKADWTPADEHQAWARLRKYRRQLLTFGIDYDSIKEPRADFRGRIKAQPSTQTFAILFEYDASLVQAVKDELLNPRFINNGSKYWIVPATHAQLDRLFAFAEKHQFKLDAEVFEYAETIERTPEPVKVEPPNPKRITMSGDVLVITFPYDAALVVAVKQIPGARFDGAMRVWNAPGKQIAFVAEFGRNYGFDCTAIESLASEALQRAENAKRQALEQTEKLRAALPDLTKAIGGRTPFAHQREGIERMIQNPRQILAWDMGLGKTFGALVVAKTWQQAFGFHIFVVCPVSLADNWLREARDVNVSIEVFSWAKIPRPLEHSNYIVIFDEAHYAQAGTKSQRGQKFLALSEHPNCQAVYCLTGTPIKNGRPVNLFPLLKATKHRLAQNKKVFEEYYCAAHETRWTRWDTTGAAHLDELYKNTQDVMLRRTKRECLDLPEKTNILRKVEMSADAARLYAETLAAMKAEYQRRLREGEIMTGGEALVQLGQLRRAGSVAKVETALEMAQEILEQGKQVVIFTEFVESAQTLHAELGGELLTGAVTGKEDDGVSKRQAMVDRFQAGKSRVFISTIRAGGVGITLTAASDVILVDRPWTPGDTQQAIDRCHRIGQKNAVTAYWLQANGCDEAIDALLMAKQERIELVLSGKRKTLRGVSNPSEMAVEVLNALFG